jgi:hypothetical protein
MNLDVSAASRIGERRMRLDGKQLLVDSVAILRQFNPYASVAGIAATLLLVSPLQDMQPIFSLLLGVAVYVGVTLLWPQALSKTSDIEGPVNPDDEAFQKAREATSRVMLLANQIDKVEVQQQVQEIGLAFDRMLNVMEEDGKYFAAPDYKAELIDPFEAVLSDYVELGKREIELASHQIVTFEETIVPQVREFTKSFYQHYHDDRVRDLAARIEIFWLTVASHEEEDADADDVAFEDDIGDESDDLELAQDKEIRL